MPNLGEGTVCKLSFDEIAQMISDARDLNHLWLEKKLPWMLEAN